MTSEKLKRIIRDLPERGVWFTFLDLLVDASSAVGCKRLSAECLRAKGRATTRRIHKESFDFSGNGVLVQEACDTIWICWWQGEEQMPPLVSMCYRSILKYCGSHPVVLLTQENYASYVKLDPVVLDKLSKGELTITSLSDIIRVNLLATKGGLWLDSTIYLTKEIDDYWFSRPFTSVSFGENPDSGFIVDTLWTSFCMGRGTGGNHVFPRLVTFFNDYLRRYDSLYEYFLLDVALRYIYDHFQDSREEIGSNKVQSGPGVSELFEHLYDSYSEDSFRALLMDCGLNKLSYKNMDYNRLMKADTVYHHLMELSLSR